MKALAATSGALHEVLLFLALAGCTSDDGPSASTPCTFGACAGAAGAGDGSAPSGGGAAGSGAGAPSAGSNNEGPPTDLAGIGGMGPDNAGGGLEPDSEAPPDAAAPGNEGADGCDVGVADANRAPAALALSGNLGAHDPVIIAAHGQYYYFSTGNGISAKVSPDLLAWSQLPAVFPQTPAWFQARVPAFTGRNIWAPDISFFGGQYHLYYSVSSFGSNRSCIGHATRPALDSGAWQDHEAVFCSNEPGQNDDFNAIDPNVILDEAGTPWMSFGSFWDGIEMIRLNLAGEREGDELVHLASRGGGSIEAPFIVRRCGFYYLFVSFGACCQGVDSTYETRVGRSSALLGPYADRDARPMLDGGGTLLLERGGDWVGPGHNAVLIDGTRAYNVYHAYAASNGASQLRISELVWDAEGWPVSGGP
jgi:arabinan endo-1,5-alpha-L-arabinosidase